MQRSNKVYKFWEDGKGKIIFQINTTDLYLITPQSEFYTNSGYEPCIAEILTSTSVKSFHIF